MVDSNCKGASVLDYNKSEGAKLGSFVINQRSEASKCRKTWNTTSHFDSQPLVNLVNYQSNFREEAQLLYLHVRYFLSEIKNFILTTSNCISIHPE